MAQDERSPARKRERSARYPGTSLADGIDLASFIDSRGLDGLGAAEVATALGYKNIKTNTFSSRLSAARQFGLLELRDEGYRLTPLAKAILHPIDPSDVPRLRRQALIEPPLYAELAERFGDKRLPDLAILANVLYHDFDIIVTAKEAAAEAFLESARFAGALGDDHFLRVHLPLTPPVVPQVVAPTPAVVAERAPVAPAPDAAPEVRIELKLWGADQGKVVRVRAPESMTPESLERLFKTITLHVRIEGPGTGGS